MTPPNAFTVHPPHGFIRLLKCCADDLDVVNAARVSYDQESDWVNAGDPMHGWNPEKGVLSSRDAGLLSYMMRNRHGTPFEHNFFKFHVRAPIFVFREWQRHRIGVSINEESARYVQLKPDFYFPDDDHCRKQVGKPGHYSYEPMTRLEALQLRAILRQGYEHQYSSYISLVKAGVAKEIARAALPVGIYSQMIWSCNARSLMAFLSLRNAPTALQEIKDYAVEMERVFTEHMPVTAEAFLNNERVAP